ncbi:MAG: tetratricopeptide repeat protein [Phycisphaerae bacterium]|nr:tetratricopeptide repeat protein [Phycisphaerae bacterium]
MRNHYLAAVSIFAVLAAANLVFAQETISPEDKALFGLAQSLNNTQDFKNAADKLEGLYAKYPDNKELAVEYAKALGYGRQIDKAVAVLNKLENQYPQDEQLIELYANILESNQKFDEALIKYQWLAEKNPDDYLLKEKIAEIAGWARNYPLSMKYYSALAAKYPKDSAIKIKQAEVCIWAKDYPKAIDYYNQILEMEPDNQAVQLKVADVYYWSGDNSKAVQAYNKLTLDPVENKEQCVNQGYALMSIGQYDEAEQAFNKLLKTYPNDPNIHIALANTYYASGNISEAEKKYKILFEQSPNDPDIAIKLVKLTASGGNHKAAIDLCRRMLEKEPQNREIKILLARILSWDGRYDESLIAYDELLRQQKSKELKKEKARVLGWMRQYEKSIKEYKSIIADEPDPLITAEMKAKESFYNMHDINGEKYHKDWLKLEPDNLEAHYDLGDIYARNNQWDKAEEQYLKILSIDPASESAKKALSKIDTYLNKSQVKIGFEFVEADSGSRNIDQRYWNIFAAIRMPLSSKTFVTVREDSTLFDFDSIGNVYRQTIGVKLEHFASESLKASVNYAYNMDSDDFGHSNTFGGEIDYKITDEWELNISHQRQDVIDNGITFRDRLYRDNYKIRTVYKPTRRLNAGADYMYSNYSDDNHRNAYGFDVDYYVSFEPRSLKLFYRYEEYSFNRTDIDYFSPDSFHYNRIGFEFRHFLNGQKMFWADRQTYYTIGYAANVDVRQQNGHTIYADLHHDWTDSCSSHIEFAKHIYENRDVYSLSRILFYTIFYY